MKGASTWEVYIERIIHDFISKKQEEDEMSEQENKCKSEERMGSNQKSDLLKNILGFVDYMNKSFDCDGTNAWFYLGECICFHVSHPHEEVVYFGHKSIVCTSERDDLPVSNELKEFVWANLNVCGYCGQELPDGITIQSNACREGDNIIFGKKFDNLCNCPIGFPNPDAEAIEKIKRLAEAWKLCITALKN